MKIKKGDNVVITAGKDRGKKGKVLKVFPQKARILVEGIQIRKKHVRPRRAGEKGQIVEAPTSLHISNANVVCPKCGKPTRIGYAVEGTKKFRVCRRCKAEIS